VNALARGRVRVLGTNGQYVNFPGLYEDNDALVRGAFGQNLGRLTAIKNQYDPTNLFRLNHNIALGQ
jgi:FAD/FMN-containing dehydrogenase